MYTRSAAQRQQHSLDRRRVFPEDSLAFIVYFLAFSPDGATQSLHLSLGASPTPSLSLSSVRGGCISMTYHDVGPLKAFRRCGLRDKRNGEPECEREREWEREREATSRTSFLLGPSAPTVFFFPSSSSVLSPSTFFFCCCSVLRKYFLLPNFFREISVPPFCTGRCFFLPGLFALRARVCACDKPRRFFYVRRFLQRLSRSFH